jgi:type II secretory pathway component GspD/PulD (secretin)
MAKYMGKALSGSVLALCVVLLTTPQTWGQFAPPQRKMLTISGSVGMPGVTMQGLPSSPQTDDNGVYTAQVEYGFTATVTPVKEGYTFNPPSRSYNRLKESQTAENYEASPKTYTISGSVGQAGVKMTGLPGDPNTDQNGRYKAEVYYGWIGVVTPEKTGWQFDPSFTNYEPVKADQTTNYRASPITFAISGSVGDVNGVTMQGLPGNPKTGAGGLYSATVPYGWTGTVTPVKEGYTFTPESMGYEPLTDNRSSENYTAKVFEFTITGTTHMADVILRGLPNNPVSDANGFYTAVVPYGYTGTVTPEYRGYAFTPPSYSYVRVTASRERQDFTPSPIRITISGNTGTGGVALVGLPDDPVSDERGLYNVKVDFDWTGTVTPTKDGWSFEDASKVYSYLETDQLNQNYTATPITYTIAGNVGQAGVLMEGLPGRVMSGPDGSYSVDVKYKWSGTVTPRKPGFEFDPPSISYEPVLSPQTGQTYTASPIQCLISGKVISLEMGAVEGAAISAEPGSIIAATDANGDYRIQVGYGWKGTIRVQKDGYTFTPDYRTLDTVVRDVPNVGFSGRVQMLTIVGVVTVTGDVDGEPIQGVTITASPGNIKPAVTDAKGKYIIAVPYGWTGALTATKEGWDFPGSIQYANVTANIDKTTKTPQEELTMTPPAAPGTQPAAPATEPDKTVAPQKPEEQKTTPLSPEEQERKKLLEQLKSLIEGKTSTEEGSAKASEGRVSASPNEPVVTGSPRGNLIDVLKRISEQTNVKIAVDATVKPKDVSVGADLVGLPVSIALDKVLDTTGYKYKVQGDTYLVYKPITWMFQGDQLRQALQDIGSVAEVPIVPDENVVGEVWLQLTDETLEHALEMILAGSPYVYKRKGNYYMVASGSPQHAAFGEVSVTQRVYLNYITPVRATELLSGAWTNYVKGSQDPNGHLITVTAPPALAARIVEDIQKLDHRPRQLLLTARVVSMERGNLLDMGVEWTFPTIAAGTFSNSYLRGTFDGDDPAGNWPWGIQIGYSPDKTFTDALLMALNLLEQTGQADIVANPQVMAQDGKESQIRNIVEEWFMMTAPTNANNFFSNSELQKIESGTTLTITPRISDNNDITLEMAVEVSDSIPSGRTSDLPVVTRRTAKNAVTIRDGGTAAVAGLTENRSTVTNKRVPGFSNLPLIGELFKNKSEDKSSREIAVFVTATIVPDNAQPAYPTTNEGLSRAAAPNGDDFREQLRAGLASQPR